MNKLIITKLILLTIMLLIITACSSETIEVEYQNITYEEISIDENNNVSTEYACITFYDDGEYSMYDCDSEVTNYYFDSENECKYFYDGDKIKFKCKYNYSNVKNKPIEIITWDKDTFEFKYNGDIKIFKSMEWIKDNLK